MNSKKQSEIELMAPEALDVEVTRIAQEKLHPHGCDLVVHRTDDGIARLLIKVQSSGREYHLIRSFSIVISKSLRCQPFFQKSWNKNAPAWLYVDECKRS